MDFPFPKSTTCTKTLDLKNGYLAYLFQSFSVPKMVHELISLPDYDNSFITIEINN